MEFLTVVSVVFLPKDFGMPGKDEVESEGQGLA